MMLFSHNRRSISVEETAKKAVPPPAAAAKKVVIPPAAASTQAAPPKPAIAKDEDKGMFGGLFGAK